MCVRVQQRVAASAALKPPSQFSFNFQFQSITMAQASCLFSKRDIDSPVRRG